MTLSRVLIEYEGPQLIEMQSPAGEMFLALSSDEDSKHSRWLVAPIDEVERDALLHGALSVRDAIVKPDVLVVDTDIGTWGTVRHACFVDGDDLPDDALPRRGALLPTDVRGAFAPKSVDRVLRIGGNGLKRHRVRFEDLGIILAGHQRIWNAISQVTAGATTTERAPIKRALGRRATMYATAAQAGSFAVSVSPEDEGMFLRIAKEYARLTLASDDPARLSETLSRLQRRVTSAYLDLLSELDKRELGVLTTWAEGASYVGATSAARIRRTVASLADQTLKDFQAIGTFRGFSYQTDTFTLVADEGESIYDGWISVALRESGKSVEVHGTKEYIATLREYASQTIHGTKNSYELISFDPSTAAADERNEE